MKPYLLEKEVQTNASSTQFAMQLGEEQLSKISRLLVTGQYTDPPLAALREIISNAYDANTEATQQDGVERHVDITVAEEGTYIRDYGKGLSEDEMNSLYTMIGRSTKEDSDVMIGAFGVGRLAPLAANDSFYITSYNGGFKTLYCCYLNDKHIPSLATWSREPSSEPTGLEVYLLHPPKDIIFKTIVRIEHLVSGSRFKINATVTEEAKNTGYKQLKSVVYERHYLQAVKEDVLNIRDFSNNLYFRVTDPETGIAYDLYKGERAADSTLYYTVIADLGGVLYSLNGSDTYAESSFVSTSYRISDVVTSRVPKTNEDLADFEQALTKEGAFTTYTFVIRLNPDSLRLSTSREEITSEDAEKAEKLANRGIELIQEEMQRRLDAVTLNTKLNGSNIYQNIGLAHKDFETKSANLKDHLGRFFEPSNVFQFKYNIGEGKTVIFTGEGQLPRLTDQQPDTLYVENLKRVGIDSENFYYLCHGSEDSLNSYMRHVLRNGFKDGAAKRKPYVETHMGTRMLCQAALPVVTSEETTITKKQLVEQFGEHVAEQPLLVVAEQFSGLLQGLDYVNYLGSVKPRERKAKQSKTASKGPVSATDKEISILLRQLRSLYNSGATRLECHSYDYKESPIPLTFPAEDLNKDLLQQKVIYSRTDDIIYSPLLKQCQVKYFLKEYYPYMFKDMTDNAYDRISRLRELGLCNWVSAKEAITNVASSILRRHHKEVEFLFNDYGYNLLKEVEPYLKDVIPQKTLNILQWNDKMVQFYKKTGEFLRNYGGYLQKLREEIATQEGPDEFSYCNPTDNSKSFFGPKLEPYYIVLTRLKGMSDAKATLMAINIVAKMQDEGL